MCVECASDEAIRRWLRTRKNNRPAKVLRETRKLLPQVEGSVIAGGYGHGPLSQRVSIRVIDLDVDRNGISVDVCDGDPSEASSRRVILEGWKGRFGREFNLSNPLDQFAECERSLNGECCRCD